MAETTVSASWTTQRFPSHAGVGSRYNAHKTHRELSTVDQFQFFRLLRSLYAVTTLHLLTFVLKTNRLPEATLRAFCYRTGSFRTADNGIIQPITGSFRTADNFLVLHCCILYAYGAGAGLELVLQLTFIKMWCRISRKLLWSKQRKFHKINWTEFSGSGSTHHCSSSFIQTFATYW